MVLAPHLLHPSSPFAKLACTVLAASPRRAKSTLELDFWSRIVPQLTHSIPCVQAAVEAFGACYQEYVLESSNPSKSVETPRRYLKALKLAQLDLSTMQHGPMPCIIACIFLAIVEAVQQRLDKGYMHLNGALSLMAPHLNQKDGREAMIDIEYVSFFQKLDLHTATYATGWAPYLSPQSSITTDDLLSEPPDKSLTRVLHSCYHFIAAACPYKYTSRRRTPPALLIEQGRQLSNMKQWLSYNQVPQQSSSASDTCIPDEFLHVLRAQCLAALINASICLDPRQTSYDSFGPEFEEIVTLIERLFSNTDQDQTSQLLSFTPEMGIIHPLYFVARKYRHRRWRRRALHLLKRSGREGPWCGQTESSVVASVIRAEEGLTDNSSLNLASFQGTDADDPINIPESNRVHVVGPVGDEDEDGSIGSSRSREGRLTRMRTWFGRGKRLQRAVTSCCLCAFVLYGYDQGVFGGILENQDWLSQFDNPGDTLTGFIVSSYNLGCLLGCFKNFMLGERLGRRWTIWVAMGWILAGAALQATATTRAHLIVGRVVTGVGTGLKTYQSELCQGAKRGRLVSAEVMFVGIGIAFAYWWDFAFSFVGGAFAWRWPLAFQAVFAIWVIFVVFGVPESPRWLLHHGNRDEAIQVLSAVYDKPIDHPDILDEVNSIEAALSIEAEAKGSTSWASAFRKDKVSTRYRIFLAWFVQFMNQAGGINLVVYYILTVLTDSVKLEHRLAQIIAGCIQLMFPIGSLLPSLALDRMGRRSTMMWGSAGLSFSMLMVAALLSQADDTARGKAFASGSIAFFFTYMLVFGASMNCVPWVYVPEILPLDARTKGTAIGVSANWLWNFTVVMITPILINRLQWKAYLIFMATNLVFVPIIYFLYPETSNLELEEVDYIFARGDNTVQVAREMQKEIALHGHLSDDRRPGKESGMLFPCVAADLSSREQTRGLVEQVFQDATVSAKHDAVSILVANAGLGRRIRDIQNIQEDDWDQVMEVNSRSQFVVTKACLPGMRAQGWGRVILVGSIASTGGGINGCHYAATKGALSSMGKNLSTVLAGEGVTVNTILPAMIGSTDMIPTPKSKTWTSETNLEELKASDPGLAIAASVPVHRLGQPVEVANVAVMMAKTGYLTGQDILLTGGLK
ncbi:hypothetical protein F66182_2259 [Fusarium sp. NRRL 66182]|nr:hypothetical protein F66182_2259 [Fusarium sp. NRRL 66182]